MKKFCMIVISGLFITNCSFAQDELEIWYKLSPEIRLNIENSPWEFRWRPDDHIIFPRYWKDRLPSGRNHIARTDIMLGVNIPHFKIFSYSKFDDLGRIYTGARLDFNTRLFKKKLLINIQERLFFGLNEESESHYYLIQYIRYAITKKIQTGILSYGKWEFGEPFTGQHWFIGPTTNFVLPFNFNIHYAFTKSIFYEHTYMHFIRLGYRIKIKPNEYKNKSKFT